MCLLGRRSHDFDVLGVHFPVRDESHLLHDSKIFVRSSAYPGRHLARREVVALRIQSLHVELLLDVVDIRPHSGIGCSCFSHRQAFCIFLDGRNRRNILLDLRVYPVARETELGGRAQSKRSKRAAAPSLNSWAHVVLADALVSAGEVLLDCRQLKLVVLELCTPLRGRRHGALHHLLFQIEAISSLLLK